MKFTDAEIAVITRVLDTVRGTIQQIGQVYAVRALIVEKGKEDILLIHKESLTIVASILMSCNQYTVSDLPIVAGIISKLEPLLKSEEANGSQVQE